MTDQEKKGFKWPWDYFHFQTKGRESIFANARYETWSNLPEAV